MTISGSGVDVDGGPTLQNVLTGSNVGHIELLGNDLFTNRGEVFSLLPAIQVGSFQGVVTSLLTLAPTSCFP